MRKVLVTGASGLLGRAVAAEFAKHSWKVIGLAYTRAKDDLIRVDLQNLNAVKDIIERHQPDVIVHCAAERSPDKVERDLDGCRKLNVMCSKNLSELAGNRNIPFIYISTDYVFDGTSPPYKETDKPNPLNQYGLTKYEGEMEVTAANSASCILRIPVLYGDEEYMGESVISGMIKFLYLKSPIKISDYETRYPCHTNDIAGVCYDLVLAKMKDPSLCSVFHWCGFEAFTKYEMLKVISEVFHLPFAHIIPDKNAPTGVAKRPQNSQLSCERLKNLGIRRHTKFSVGVYKAFIKFF